MFLTDLIVKAAPQPNQWILTAPLVWSDAMFGNLTAPAGTTTDLESVPVSIRYVPWIDSVFDDDGVTRRPAAMHDYLYRTGIWPKAKADYFLRMSMISEGASKSAAATVYWGVRLLGQSSWDADAKLRQ